MGIYIRNIDIPEIKRGVAAIINIDDILFLKTEDDIVLIPDHGDLIDRDALNDAMYHEAFETDSALQKWDSGCWIRYKMFERHRDSAPVVIPAERRNKNEDCEF